MAEPRTGGSRPDRALGDTVSRMVLVTGLDLSQTSTGIARAWVDLDNPANLGTYTTTVGSTGAAGDTLHQRHRRLVSHRNRIREDLGNPDLLLIEGPSYASPHQRGVVDMAGLRWLVLHSVLSDLDVEHVVEVPPSTLKLWAAASGATRGAAKVTKSVVRQHIVARYGWLFDVPSSRAGGHDIADAVALATLGLARLGCHYAPLDDDRRRALEEGITWPAGMETAGGLPTPRDLDHPASAVTTMTTEGLTP